MQRSREYRDISLDDHHPFKPGAFFLFQTTGYSPSYSAKKLFFHLQNAGILWNGIKCQWKLASKQTPTSIQWRQSWLNKSKMRELMAFFTVMVILAVCAPSYGKFTSELVRPVVSQSCRSRVRVVPQSCHSCVTVVSELTSRATVVSQSCHSRVTVVSQSCHSCVTVVSELLTSRARVVPQSCHSRVTVVSQSCHSRATVVPQLCHSTPISM